MSPFHIKARNEKTTAEARAIVTARMGAHPNQSPFNQRSPPRPSTNQPTVEEIMRRLDEQVLPFPDDPYNTKRQIEFEKEVLKETFRLRGREFKGAVKDMFSLKKKGGKDGDKKGGDAEEEDVKKGDEKL